VILAGGGVIMSGGRADTVALAELLHAPGLQQLLHNDSFPASHPLWCGPLGYQGSKAAMKLIARADVVLALGTRLGPFGTLRSTEWSTGRPTRRSSRFDADPRVPRAGEEHQRSASMVMRAPWRPRWVERLRGRELACRRQPARAQDLE